MAGERELMRELMEERDRLRIALASVEGRHRFLVALAAATQPLRDPTEVMATTARLLAEHLGVDRCAYAEVEDQAIFVITGDHTRGVPSIVGRWPVAAFGGECERRMLANEPYVIDDVDADARAGADLEAYRQTTIQAVICVPLHKDGRFAAAMAVHQQTPRHWSPEEIDLVLTVVAQCWETLERTRVERGLAGAADRLALAFSAASLGDWSWEPTTDVVTLSVRAAEIFGIPPGAVLTWPQLLELLHADDRERAKLAVARSVEARTPYDVEYRRVGEHGAVTWVRAMGRAQYRADGTTIGMFGVVQDVNEKKRLEQELERRVAELAEADRTKDDFIALLAHELRNPLAPVRAGLQIMRLAPDDPRAVADARAMMDRQLAHMVRLIDDLLDVSRMGRNKLHLQRARVSLAEVVDHALEAARPAVEAAGLALHVSLPPTPIELDADLTRLAQVLGNLLTNSAKYTQRGGDVWLTAVLEGEHAVVSVRDSGIGLPAEALPRLFDMFSQVDRSLERATGGLGIGLALVKGLVEAHGGTVTVESAGTGAGSTFTLRLPVAPAARAAVEPAPETRAPTSRRRVLVVDDNHDAAGSLADLLELLGHEVAIAHDGVEAVETAERFRPELVLMDVGMPRLNGLDATRQLRARPWAQGVRVVALTGWGQEDDRKRSRAAGCDAHVVKPVSLQQLQALLA